MLGSYGPSPDGKPYTKDFDPEESPSGMLARSGSYAVKSRVVDDDNEIYTGKILQLRVRFDNLFGRVWMVIQNFEGMVTEPNPICIT